MEKGPARIIHRAGPFDKGPIRATARVRATQG
ncbi:hypothetical protein Gbro_1230 [Gordonia bronchialis DSM 43247]|uniref:Uncharacterized protein n=1 Tax=Gordonia bronchialis (strain ATCC 25592 / DSM 43247 / BCRC 13721 / JCM 3198 / KCTC 3076 / NBRC 16047 / NCTC 10667) TaxID=526226 RepID=D0L5J7_GORB4|nr:hypothetical protein Gbro_1230 [Gordonia bronchialis DSM 43247]